MNATSKDNLILIVEDEPKLAALLADYLTVASYKTQIVADGREVIPAVKAAPRSHSPRSHAAGT